MGITGVAGLLVCPGVRRGACDVNWAASQRTCYDLHPAVRMPSSACAATSHGVHPAAWRQTSGSIPPPSPPTRAPARPQSSGPCASPSGACTTFPAALTNPAVSKIYLVTDVTLDPSDFEQYKETQYTLSRHLTVASAPGGPMRTLDAGFTQQRVHVAAGVTLTVDGVRISNARCGAAGAAALPRARAGGVRACSRLACAATVCRRTRPFLGQKKAIGVLIAPLPEQGCQARSLPSSINERPSASQATPAAPNHARAASSCFHRKSIGVLLDLLSGEPGAAVVLQNLPFYSYGAMPVDDALMLTTSYVRPAGFPGEQRARKLSGGCSDGARADAVFDDVAISAAAAAPAAVFEPEERARSYDMLLLNVTQECSATPSAECLRVAPADLCVRQLNARWGARD